MAEVIVDSHFFLIFRTDKRKNTGLIL